ncbi:MAG: L-aspartate oxidase [Bacteroidales bacterium]|jgi:L-aspartate oxidase|nr:L-aspartate oxidase [Bacteroidales bacterium]
MKKEVDFLVIGSGIAGLSFALKVADKGTVLLISKTDLLETNTKYAQGGIAAVTYKPDDFENHINDTLICGDGLCNRETVEMVVKEGPKQIEQLIKWNVNFDKNDNGKFDLGKEGGHSDVRVLHHKDNTGEEIQKSLVKKVREHKNIKVLENYFAVDLITQHHLGELILRNNMNIECYGAYILNLKTEKVDTILAKVTVLATGGTGNLYETTTNPPIATGDGIAMAYRTKALIENMQFIQFHPTSLFNPGEKPSFLITEALRGFGAILKTIAGEEFMKKYDERESLAPRDIVARAIDKEMKMSGDDYVVLDARHIDGEKLKSHFPNIYKKCLNLSIDITRDLIPVIPAAHYSCGGVKVDINGRSSVNRLYAIGEVSSTGLHGANRLASNSLTEAIVYADRAAKDSLKRISQIKIISNIPEWNTHGTTYPEEMIMITQNYKEMQMVMSNYVGIVRSDLRLARALKRLEVIYQETELLYERSILSQRLCELRNLIDVGYLIIKMARDLHESRGLHYTIDYPEKSNTSEF